MSRVSQQDLTYIAEFLRGFDKIELNASKRKGVNLEKLGQYLRQDPLQTCFSPEGSEWASMLVENRCLQTHPLIIKQDFEGSLLQAHLTLIETVNQVFVCAYQDLTQHFKQKVMPLLSVTSTLCSQIVTTDGNLMIAVPNSDHKILQLFKINFTTMGDDLVSKMIKIDIGNKQGKIILNLESFIKICNSS
jgi:anaphase-promoting complex subunit 4